VQVIRTAIDCVLLVGIGLRLYLRQIVYQDVAWSTWRKLREGCAVPLVSSFILTARAMSIMVNEVPWTQAGFMAAAAVSSAQSPVVSLLISAVVSAPVNLVASRLRLVVSGSVGLSKCMCGLAASSMRARA
jgi:hypothetical protein